MHPALGAAGAVLAAGAACVGYGVAIERRWYRRRELTLAAGVLTRGTDRPLRILHLSDIHLDPPQEHRVRFLESLRDADHDLVVITGDLLGSEHAEDAVVDAVAGLVHRDVPGIVTLGSNDLFGPLPRNPLAYVLGSDDRRTYGPRLDTARLVTGLRTAGYEVLRNATTTVHTRLGPVAVGGMDDPHLTRGTSLASPSVLSVERTADPVLRLGVVHAPYTAALDVLVDAGYDLLLAGHTHGGQVRFPPYGAVVNNCDLPLDQSRGASRWRDVQLHVSPGLGHGRYAPFRFACRPEATLLACSA